MDGEKDKPNEEQDFRKKRQNYSLAIRRKEREELIARKRNLPEQSSSTNQLEEDNKSGRYIVDPRFAEYVLKLHKSRYPLEILPELVQGIYDADILKQLYGLVGVRKIMSLADQPPIQAIVDTGIIPKLIQYINQEEYPQLQLEATWALTNVASGTPQQCQSIVDKGVIPMFIKLLRSQVIGIIEQAIWALGNIASDSTIHRDAIIRNGGLQNLIYAIQNMSDPELLEQSAWALSNICRGQPLPSYEIIKDCIPVLVDLISRGFVKDKSILADCCWAISYNTNSESQRIQLLIDHGLPHCLVANLRENYYTLLVPTVRMVGHLTMGNFSQVDSVVQEEGFFDCIYELLMHEKRIIRAEACWIISNIAAGSTKQVDMLISRDDIIEVILRLFETDENDVKREITHLFSNLTGEGNPQRIFTFFQTIGIVRFYLINLHSQDPKLLRDCLTNLYSILKFGQNFKMPSQNGGSSINFFVQDLMNNGGVSILEQLQLHQHKVVYENVIPIVREFFVIDEDADI